MLVSLQIFGSSGSGRSSRPKKVQGGDQGGVTRSASAARRIDAVGRSPPPLAPPAEAELDFRIMPGVTHSPKRARSYVKHRRARDRARERDVVGGDLVTRYVPPVELRLEQLVGLLEESPELLEQLPTDLAGLVRASLVRATVDEQPSPKLSERDRYLESIAPSPRRGTL
jgi:hypothetical protein